MLRHYIAIAGPQQTKCQRIQVWNQDYANTPWTEQTVSVRQKCLGFHHMLEHCPKSHSIERILTLGEFQKVGMCDLDTSSFSLLQGAC